MEKLYDIEYVIDGINRQETGLTEEEADTRAEELKNNGAEEIRVIER